MKAYKTRINHNKVYRAILTARKNEIEYKEKSDRLNKKLFPKSERDVAKAFGISRTQVANIRRKMENGDKI